MTVYFFFDNYIISGIELKILGNLYVILSIAKSCLIAGTLNECGSTTQSRRRIIQPHQMFATRLRYMYAKFWDIPLIILREITTNSKN